MDRNIPGSFTFHNKQRWCFSGHGVQWRKGVTPVNPEAIISLIIPFLSAELQFH